MTLSQEHQLSKLTIIVIEFTDGTVKTNLPLLWKWALEFAKKDRLVS